jgi:F-type H+-transporting ATPase subunit delta
MRYAKALFQFATERGAEKTVYDECKNIVSAFSKEKLLSTALASPMVTPEKKISLVAAAANPTEGSLDNVLEDFVRLVMHNCRETYLGSIATMYIDLYRRKKHVGVARLITAVPLAAPELERIKKESISSLHASDMEFDTIVDPSIEGGFIFDFNDFRMDASIRNQLKLVKEQLVDRNRRIV